MTGDLVRLVETSRFRIFSVALFELVRLDECVGIFALGLCSTLTSGLWLSFELLFVWVLLEFEWSVWLSFRICISSGLVVISLIASLFKSTAVLSVSSPSTSLILYDIIECSGVISLNELSFSILLLLPPKNPLAKLFNFPCSISSLWRRIVSWGTDAKYGVGSKFLNGKLTTFWDFTHLLFTKLNRFKWTIRIGGSFQIWSFFVAGCLPLQWPQWYDSSSFSSVVNARKQWSKSTGSVCCFRQIATESCSVQICLSGIIGNLSFVQ